MAADCPSWPPSLSLFLLHPIRLPVDIANSVKDSVPRLPGVWVQFYALNWPIPVKKEPLGALVVYKPPSCFVSLEPSSSFASRLGSCTTTSDLPLFYPVSSSPRATEAQHPPLALNLATLLGFDSDTSFSVCLLPATLGYNLDWETSKHLAVSASMSAKEERSLLFFYPRSTNIQYLRVPNKFLNSIERKYQLVWV